MNFIKKLFLIAIAFAVIAPGNLVAMKKGEMALTDAILNPDDGIGEPDNDMNGLQDGMNDLYVQHPDADLFTLLCEMCQEGNNKVVHLIASNFPYLVHENEYRGWGFHLAKKFNQFVHMLLSINQPKYRDQKYTSRVMKEGWTCLHWAAFGPWGAYGKKPQNIDNQLEVCETLLRWGANPLARTAAGDLPSKIAFDSGNIELGEWLQSIEEKGNTIECEICFETTDDHKILVCGHRHCTVCLRMTLDGAMRDKKVTHLGCPSSGCTHVLTHIDVHNIVNGDEAVRQQYNIIAFEEWVAIKKGMRHCPTPGCNYTFDNKQNCSMSQQCPRCHCRYCANCLLIHQDDISCAQARATAPDAETIKALRKKARQCPRCGYYVQKNGGCNMMTCRCNHHFYYCCGADIVGFGGHAPHCGK